MIDLLKTMIEASKAATLPLDMQFWHCGTSCCLCGDAAAYVNKELDVHCLTLSAKDFSFQLDCASESLFYSAALAESIYGNDAGTRVSNAELSKLFTKEELKHPHLTTDHCDRAIAIDYIEMVIRKCEEKLGE